jgi:hypothetical protein
MPTAKHLLLPAGRATTGRHESWPLPREAARVLATVAPTAIPVLCLGSSAAAFGRIATAIHRASGRSRIERFDLSGDVLGRILALPRGPESLYLTIALDGIEHLEPEGQTLLAEYLDQASPRIVSATRTDLALLSSRWDPDLLDDLTLVRVLTPSLAERRDELPELARIRLAALCTELGLESWPTLGADAEAALAAHDWPGDVTEFDAVLLATILRENPSPTIGAADLQWHPLRPPRPAAPRPRRSDDGEATETERNGGATETPSRPRGNVRHLESVPRPDEPATTPSSHPEADGPGGEGPSGSGAGERAAPGPDAPGPSEPTPAALESIAIELAHELKNPLVPIKTFVANVARMNREEIERFGELALEGIERIDAPLEDILDFSQLPESPGEALEVSAVLQGELQRCESALASRNVSVRGLPSTALPTSGGRPLLEFALRLLCRHLAQTATPGTPISILRPAADRIALHYRPTATAAHLEEAASQGDRGLPLALMLVRGALIRMGADLRTRHNRDETTIELRFATG